MPDAQGHTGKSQTKERNAPWSDGVKRKNANGKKRSGQTKENERPGRILHYTCDQGLSFARPIGIHRGFPFLNTSARTITKATNRKVTKYVVGGNSGRVCGLFTARFTACFTSWTGERPKRLEVSLIHRRGRPSFMSSKERISSLLFAKNQLRICKTALASLQ